MKPSKNENSAKATKPYFTSQLQTDIGFVRIKATHTHVCEILFFNKSAATHENDISQKAASQVKEYFAGIRQSFDLPLSPAGTAFQQKVWQQLTKVQYGTTASYLDIARALDKASACRAVGSANGKNPISIVIPCHRIIGASGKLTGYAGGLERKAFLLSLEAKQG